MLNASPVAGSLGVEERLELGARMAARGGRSHWAIAMVAGPARARPGFDEREREAGEDQHAAENGRERRDRGEDEQREHRGERRLSEE